MVFTLIIVLFSIANVDTVRFSYLFGSLRMPLILVIIGSILIGALLIGFFTYSTIYKQRHRISKLERELHRLIELHPEDSDRIKVEITDEDDTARETRTAERRSKR
nr:LapA family protein [Sporolactobacillus kofuensis]